MSLGPCAPLAASPSAARSPSGPFCPFCGVRFLIQPSNTIKGALFTLRLLGILGYICVLATPLTSLCLEGLLALLKNEGVPTQNIVAYSLSIQACLRSSMPHSDRTFCSFGPLKGEGRLKGTYTSDALSINHRRCTMNLQYACPNTLGKFDQHYDQSMTCPKTIVIANASLRPRAVVSTSVPGDDE